MFSSSLLMNCSLRLPSAVFQAGGLVVVLVEVNRKPYLASIVPVIVNAILNEHQIIVDIVAFVNKGDFPRSRLGEKQRGKILAGWVTRKMRTLAQFAIRDMDGESAGGGGDGGDANRISRFRMSGVPPVAGSSSLRNVEHAPQIPEMDEAELQKAADGEMEMGPEEEEEEEDAVAAAEAAAGMMPTRLLDRDALDDQAATPTGYPQAQGANRGGEVNAHQDGYFADGPVFSSAPAAPPKIQLPGVDGREGYAVWTDDDNDQVDDWTASAIMHMNLAGGMPPR